MNQIYFSYWTISEIFFCHYAPIALFSWNFDGKSLTNSLFPKEKKSLKLLLPGVAAQAVSSVEDILADLDDKIKSSASYTGDSHARTESVGATKTGNEDLIRLSDGSNNASQRDTGSRTVFPQSTHDANQDVGYPSSQQWGLDWRQYADEAASIGLRHFDREAEADVKAVHSAGK